MNLEIVASFIKGFFLGFTMVMCIGLAGMAVYEFASLLDWGCL